MRESLLKILKCPICHAEDSLSIVLGSSDGREIREGHVECIKCSHAFAIHAGVLDVLAPGSVREEVLREMKGWENIYGGWFDMSGKSDNFWLVQPDNQETTGITSDEFIRRLPHFDRIGDSFQKREGFRVDCFNELIEMVNFKPGDRLLELGAGRCWTVRDFTRRGCSCVATDIMTTKYLGLESSDIYFEEDPGLYWDRVRCDMENLPFTAGSFDYVFCNAVLHHTKDMQKVINEIWRVLIFGGKLLVVNEPDYGVLDHRAHKAEQDSEAEVTDANENLYNQRYFIKQLRKVGFRTDFRPYRSMVRHHASRLYQYLERHGIRNARVMNWLELMIKNNEWLVRRLVGLGTMGVAEKPIYRSNR